MNQNRSLLILLFLASAIGVFSQSTVKQLTVKGACNYNGESFDAKVYTFDSDNAAVEAVDRILKPVGLARNFQIRAADVDNAAAVIQGETRYLLYNQAFIRRVKIITNTDWAAISIMAHEVGHHLNGHTLVAGGDRRTMELEADSFSGFVLYKMGATLEQSQAAMNTIPTEAGSPTHPPKRARLAAIESGWTKAKDQDKSGSQNPETPSGISDSPRSSPKITLNEIEQSYKSNLINETIQKARIFLQAEPNNSKVNLYLGFSLLIKKDVDNAVVHLEKAIKLGESIVIPVKTVRTRGVIKTLFVNNGEIGIAKNKLAIKEDNKIFEIDLSGLTQMRLDNYQNQCPIVQLDGMFTENRTNSNNKKQEAKTFYLFPMSTTLQPTTQNNIVVNVIVCNDEGIANMTIVKLLNRLLVN